MPIVSLPTMKPGANNESLVDERVIVILGANGTGKSTLGAQIERTNGERAHRISAQRSLHFPPTINPRNYDEARNRLRFGTHQETWTARQHAGVRDQRRWNGYPTYQPVSDYELMLEYLFAESVRRDHDYVRPARQALPTSLAPDCKLDQLQRIWSRIMPTRELTIADHKVQISAGSSHFLPSQLSDGERVCFYFVGQILCAAEGSIVIIDEPETHLHRAVRSILWDELEAAREDCTFIYLTHDLDFAASRAGAKFMWLKSFDGRFWDWEWLPDSTLVPDRVACEVLGSRRRVLLVEGACNSYDQQLYGALYPDRVIIPCGSCQKVIEATKSLRTLAELHHLNIHGLIDRDERTDAEVKALLDAGIIVISVASVENLFCLPEVLQAVAEQQFMEPSVAEITVKTAQERIMTAFKASIDQKAGLFAIKELQLALGSFGAPRSLSASDIGKNLQSLLATLDIPAIIAKWLSNFRDVSECEQAMRYHSCKDVLQAVAKCFDLNAKGYQRMVVNLVKQPKYSGARNAMRASVGLTT